MAIIMNIVAIVALPENREEAAGRLVKALGLSLYEARQRLGAGGGSVAGPIVVGAFAEKERAGLLLEKLQSEGFSAMLLEDEALQAEAGIKSVKRFELGETGLALNLTDGGSLILPYLAINLIIRGRTTSTNIRTETKVERKFSLQRTLITQGLSMTKKEKTVHEIKTVEQEGFANIYSDGLPAVCLPENRLLYDSLGLALKPTRAANFGYLIQELRRRCTQARYDERLLNKFAYTSMLGPSLHLEKYPFVATALLFKTLTAR